MEWLKGQGELEGAEEVKDMVSVCKKGWRDFRKLHFG